MMRWLWLVLILLAPSVMAQTAADPLSMPAITLSTDQEGEQTYSVSLQILLLMSALTFIPAFVMMMTSFTRIIIVFSILRQALGLQQTPSSQILIGLALFLTLFVMAPVFERINETALQPYLAEELTPQQAVDAASIPLRAFMLAQTRETDLELFVRLAQRTDLASPDDVPFLVIDLVVASVLMAMGMMMLSPLIISLPFKIMLFVLVDGWALIIGTLAASFAVV